MVKNLFKDLLKYLPSNIVPAIIGIIMIPIVTRILKQEEYGNYILALTSINLLTTLSATWICNSVIRFYPAYNLENRLDTFRATIAKLIFTSIFICCFIAGIGFVFFRKFINQIYYPLFYISVLVFILYSFYNVCLDFLRAKRQAVWYSGFTIWRSGGGLVFGVLMIILFNMRVEGLLWGLFITFIIALPLLFKLSMQHFSIREGKIFSAMSSEIFHYGFPLVFLSGATWIVALSDRYIIGLFRNSVEVAIYSVGHDIPQKSTLLIVTLFSMAQVPIAFQIWEKDGAAAICKFLTKISRYYLLIAFPAAVGLSVLSKRVIIFFTTPEYLYGYRVIPFAAAGILIMGISNIYSVPITCYKKTNLILYGNIFTAIFNLTINFMFVPKYGYMIAALANFTTYFLGMVIKIVISKFFILWNFPFKSLFNIALASGLMGLIVYYLSSLFHSNALSISIGVIVGAVVYPFILFFLREFKLEEINFVKANISFYKRLFT